MSLIFSGPNYLEIFDFEKIWGSYIAAQKIAII